MISKNFFINNIAYKYSVIESKRAKRVRIQINTEGRLELIKPVGVSIEKAESFLSSKSNWIERNTKKVKCNSVGYRYLGNEINIQRKFDLFLTEDLFFFENSFLKILSPANSNKSERQLFDEWIKERAKEFIPHRLKFFAAKYGFKTGKVLIKTQKTLWGSYSAKGTFCFNSKLLYFNSQFIDYVLIHELCHTKEMNHSKKFWDLVTQLVPEYKSLKIS